MIQKPPFNVDYRLLALKKIFTLFNEIPEALEKTQKSMPADFTKKIADSISNGIRTRYDYLKIYLGTT